MGNITTRPHRGARHFLVAAAGCFISGSALAVPVTDYITVQPIDVCGAVCVPINNKGQTFATAPTGAVGFIDSKGMNVTRAIWNQIGVDVTFLPAAQYVNSSFLTLNVDAGSNPLTSTDFQNVSQQPAISTGTVPNPTTPPGVPVSQNAPTINMFFVSKLNPITPPGGTLYGFSWIDNNGVAVASNSLIGVGARPDSVAHEIGHDLDLNHQDAFNPNAALNNLMTAGNTRNLPSTINPLGTLALGTTDQLNAAQQSQVLLSGFMNPIAGVSGTVTAPMTPAAAALAAVGAAAPVTGPFHVSFNQPGRPGEFLGKLTLAAPTGVFFQDGTFAASLATVTARILAEGTELELDFTPHTFTIGDTLDYTVGVCQREGSSEKCDQGRPDLLLEGGTYTYRFETDNLLGMPIEQFVTTSDLLSPGDGIEDLFSDSQNPDLSMPSEILNPTTFVGFGALPCTPVNGSCPALTLEDADPAEENPAVPEPPSILVLLAAFVVFPVVYRFAPRARSSFEAGLA